MSRPMLTLQSGPAPAKKTVANLLPCRVNHSGVVEPVDAYWSPGENEDGSKTAFFRGRKLHGKTLKLPDGYRGVVVAEGDSRAPQQSENSLDQEQDQEPQTGNLETKAEFDRVVVWGHEATADASADPFVRGMEEWVGLAEQIHAHPKSN